MSREKMKGERSIEIDGETWGWKVGSAYVVIRKPNRHAIQVPKYHENGSPNLDIGQLGGGDDDESLVVITPRTVTDYIRRYKAGELMEMK